MTPSLIQSLMNEFAADRSPKTCRNFHGLLSAVLKIHRPELILRTTLPPKRKKNIYVPDREEVEKISAIAFGTSVYIPFLLATQCGLRASEISGLELKDVHEDYIEITQARVTCGNDEALKSPKSASGYRKVPIDKRLYETLLANADGDRICSEKSRTISNNWCKFRKKHGLNAALNFHALRHHFCSKCLLLGIPQKYIAELMGHCDTTMVERVYQHTFPSAMAGYAEQLRKCGSDFFDGAQCAECNTKSSMKHEKPLSEAV